MVSIEKVTKGVAAYLDREFLPKLSEKSWERLVAGTAIALILRKASEKAEAFRENQVVKLTGIFDQDGNVDVACLRDEVKRQLPPDGLKIELPKMGTVKLVEADIDKIYQYITE